VTFFSLVDLGDENDRNLKMPTERTAETAQETTTQLDEQASTEVAKVKKTDKKKRSEFVKYIYESVLE
jgi:hypothetical protein